MVYARGVSFPTHILYADDDLIFCTGTKHNICCVLNIFHEYSEISGQIINHANSRFFYDVMIVASVTPQFPDLKISLK